MAKSTPAPSGSVSELFLCLLLGKNLFTKPEITHHRGGKKRIKNKNFPSLNHYRLTCRYWVQTIQGLSSSLSLLKNNPVPTKIHKWVVSSNSSHSWISAQCSIIWKKRDIKEENMLDKEMWPLQPQL